MAVRATKRDAQSALLELVCHRLGVLDGLFLQLLELFCLCKLEGQCQCRKDIDVRSALLSREDCRIDLFCNCGVCGQQHRPARTIEALVRCGHDHMCDADRRGDYARRDESADVRDIRQEVCSDFICDLAELLPIRDPGIRRVAGDDQLWSCFQGLFTDLVIIQSLIFIDGVMHRLEPFPRAVDRRAVRKMPAMQQVQSHNGLAKGNQSLIDRVVGRRTG